MTSRERLMFVIAVALSSAALILLLSAPLVRG